MKKLLSLLILILALSPTTVFAADSELYGEHIIVFDVVEYPENFSEDIYVEALNDITNPMSSDVTSFYATKENNYHCEVPFFSNILMISVDFPGIDNYYLDWEKNNHMDDYEFVVKLSILENPPDWWYMFDEEDFETDGIENIDDFNEDEVDDFDEIEEVDSSNETNPEIEASNHLVAWIIGIGALLVIIVITIVFYKKHQGN